MKKEEYKDFKNMLKDCASNSFNKLENIIKEDNQNKEDAPPAEKNDEKKEEEAPPVDIKDEKKEEEDTADEVLEM